MSLNENLISGALLTAVTLAFNIITKRTKAVAAKKKEDAKPKPKEELNILDFIKNNKAFFDKLDFIEEDLPQLEGAARGKFNPPEPILPFEKTKDLPDGLWQNWGKNQNLYPFRYFVPKKQDDLKLLLEKAIEARKENPTLRIRLHSHSHSWNNIFVDSENDWLVSMEEYMNHLSYDEKIKFVKNFKAKSDDYTAVEMWASTKTGDFEQFALKNRVCLAQDLILETALYGGVIATGCHSSSLNQRLISDLVLGIDFLQVNKDNKVVLTQLRDPEHFPEHGTSQAEWNAAKVNLGLFGIMQKIIFRVEKNMLVRVSNITPPLKDYYPQNISGPNVNLKKIVEENYYTEVFWYPFNSYLDTKPFYDAYANDKMYIKIMKKTEEKQGIFNRFIKEPFMKFVTGITSYIRTGIGASTMGKLTKFNPKSTPELLAMGFKLLTVDTVVKDDLQLFTDAMHFQYDIDMSPVRNLEVVFKVDKDFINATQMFTAIIDYVKEKHDIKLYPINLTVECRFTRGSNSLLAANYPCKDGESADDVYCWLEVVSSYDINKSMWNMLVNELGERWYKICPDMRSHWAKDQPSLKSSGLDSVAFMRKQYGEKRLAAFNEFRVKHDPRNFFINNWLSNVFGIKDEAKP